MKIDFNKAKQAQKAQAEAFVLPAGEYEAKVLSVEEYEAGTGSLAARISARIQTGDAKRPQLTQRWDFYYEKADGTPIEFGMARIAALGEAAGGEADENGELDMEDLEGRRVLVKLKVQKAKPNPKGGEYPAKNEATDFKPLPAKGVKPSSAPPADDPEGEPPF